MREEWAQTADDVLWRRTKLGLHLDASGRAAVDAWISARERAGTASASAAAARLAAR